MRVWLVTSWLGPGKSLTFFYSALNCGPVFEGTLSNKLSLTWAWPAGLFMASIVSFLNRCTAKTQNRKFETKTPRKGIARRRSQIPHSCVCERFIYSQNRSAYSATGKYVDWSCGLSSFSVPIECISTDSYWIDGQWGRGSFLLTKRQPELEFLNNLWGQGTE